MVGNGFDVAHGLNTNYWSLRKYIEEKDAYFLRAFETLYDIQPLDDTEPWYTEEAQERWNKSVNYNLWSEFEKAMGNPNTAEMLDQSQSVTEGMPSYGIRYHMDLYWKEEFKFTNNLQAYVKEWIESVDTSYVQCKKKEMVDSDDYFLNFNYTDVLEKVYNAKNVIHIHGGVDSVCDIPPIMGHCNKKDIERHRKWMKEADDEFEEAEASIQDAVANYLETIYKDCRKQIMSNFDFFKRIKNINQVIVIGWSAGNADFPYLEEIIKHIRKDTKWTVYWYDNKAYTSLKSAFKRVEITDESIIEYIQSNEFWDK